MPKNNAWTIALLTALALGCGQSGGDATVEGKVTLDGFPLESGSVVFVGASSKKMTAASGKIDEQGNYNLVIGRSTDLDSGEYLAQVKSVGPAIKQPDGAPPLPGELLTPAKYAKAETSGLRYRLRPGKNVIDIALASDPEAEPEGESAEQEPADEAVAAEGETGTPEAEEVPSEEPPAEEATSSEQAAAPAEEASETEEQPAE